MSFFLSVFPIVLLIYLMVKRNALPSYVALPWVAVLVMVVHLLHFHNPDHRYFRRDFIQPFQ